MVTGPAKRLKHASHASGKLFVLSLSHALQHVHLLLFDFTVYHKVIEILCAHGHPLSLLLKGTSTKQAGSDNAHAKYVDETVRD